MIDTHIHLLEPERFTYPWTRDFAALSGRFDLADYEKITHGCGIECGVFMEVDCIESAGEARLFCALAEKPGCLIRAVVAAGRPENDGFEDYLDSIAHPRLAGIRRVLHTQPDELSRSGLFRHHVARLGARGLSFDICMTQRQLPIAFELAKSCPDTRMILDHCGCPDVAAHGDAALFDDWVEKIRAIASLPNVVLKLSGITAYAAPAQRNADALRPYLETALENFGADRILWGGDWPVVNLGNGLPAWVDITRELLKPLSELERSQILSGTARMTYRIP